MTNSTQIHTIKVEINNKSLIKTKKILFNRNKNSITQMDFNKTNFQNKSNKVKELLITFKKAIQISLINIISKVKGFNSNSRQIIYPEIHIHLLGSPNNLANSRTIKV